MCALPGDNRTPVLIRYARMRSVRTASPSRFALVALAASSVAVGSFVFANSSAHALAVGTAEAELMAFPVGTGQVVPDTAASGGSSLLLWSNTTATLDMTVPTAGAVFLRAKGDQCAGAPTAKVTVDGQPVGTLTVASSTWQNYQLPGLWFGGKHTIAVGFDNDYTGGGCDRNLRLDTVGFSRPPVVSETETAAVTPGAGQPNQEQGASGGSAMLLWSNGTATAAMTAPSGGRLVVRARGDLCQGSPTMTVSIDGGAPVSTTVDSAVWRGYPVGPVWLGGTHTVAVGFNNDFTGGGCDRNLRVDAVGVATSGTFGTVPSAPAPTTAPPVVPPAPVPTPAPTTAPPVVQSAPAPVVVPDRNPFVGTIPYVRPISAAKTAADARRSYDPAGAAALDKVASGTVASWYGDWVPTSNLAAQVSAQVGQENAVGGLPVLVAYAIPHRDCGSFSAGGLAGPDAYRMWIGQLAAGIGNRRAAVILEPDALPQLTDCLDATGQAERLSMLSGAVSALAANPGTSVYLDAGGTNWIQPAVMADRLNRAGVDKARGFSSNVSGFALDADVRTYAAAVSAGTGGKHALIDSARNGQGTGDTWCNPAGRGLGRRLTVPTGDPIVDAYTWVKTPGESDGTCNGGPSAGQFWVDYAIGLGQRASF